MKKAITISLSVLLISFGLFFMVLSYDMKNDEMSYSETQTVESMKTSVVGTAQQEFYDNLIEEAVTPTVVVTGRSCTITTTVSNDLGSANVYATFFGDGYFETCIEWLRLNKDTKVVNGLTYKTFLDESNLASDANLYCTIPIENSSVKIQFSSNSPTVGKFFCDKLRNINKVDA